MHKRIFAALIIAVSVLVFTGCISTGGLSQSRVKTDIKNGSWGSPSDHALLFGDTDTWNEFLQQNPKFGYQFYDVSWRNEAKTILFISFPNPMAFLEPLPVGSELKLFSTSSTYHTGNYVQYQTTYYGIAGVDVVLNKPGLFFYSPYGEDKNHRRELKALKILQKYVKGTSSEWESLIAARIGEIKNEK